MSLNKLRALAAAPVLAIGLSAMAGGPINTPEIEPNEGKATATPAGPMQMGDTLSGNTTGTSAAAGAASRDFFRVSVQGAAPGIYKHRLTINNLPGHSGAIMGVAQSGAASDTVTINTTSASVRYNQWYGFGGSADVNYRVQGTASTTADYQVEYSSVAVTPVSLGSYQPGSMSITTFGQGHTTDTEMFLYDSSFNLLRLNDDRPAPATGFQSTIDDTLAAGVYYLAVSNFNTATSAALESSATERSTTGNRMDFDGTIARATNTIGVNVSFAITNDLSTTQFPAILDEAQGIYWGTFTVVPAPGAMALLGLGGLAGLRRRR